MVRHPMRVPRNTTDDTALFVASKVREPGREVEGVGVVAPLQCEVPAARFRQVDDGGTGSAVDHPRRGAHLCYSVRVCRYPARPLTGRR